MDIKSIKSKIDKTGYDSYIMSGDLIIGEKKGDIPTVFPALIEFHSFCLVSIKNDKILINFNHDQGGLVIIEEFSSINEAISFIKKKFPL